MAVVVVVVIVVVRVLASATHDGPAQFSYLTGRGTKGSEMTRLLLSICILYSAGIFVLRGEHDRRHDACHGREGGSDGASWPANVSRHVSESVDDRSRLAAIAAVKGGDFGGSVDECRQIPTTQPGCLPAGRAIARPGVASHGLEIRVGGVLPKTEPPLEQAPSHPPTFSSLLALYMVYQSYVVWRLGAARMGCPSCRVTTPCLGSEGWAVLVPRDRATGRSDEPCDHHPQPPCGPRCLTSA